MLDIAIDRTGPAAVISLKGSMTVEALGDLRARLKEIIKDGVVTITLDMAGVAFIDSGGVGLLASLYNTLTPKGGMLVLIEVSRELYTFFCEMRLHTHFSITQRVEHVST
jgi:anti-anti-sigma factor